MPQLIPSRTPPSGDQQIPSYTGESFYAPRKDEGGMVTLNGGTATATQTGTRWTVVHDGSASNTAPLAFALLWPLLDLNNAVYPGGKRWLVPRSFIRVWTPPGEASDLWVGTAIVGGPDFTGEFCGGGLHYDAAGGPDARRYDEVTSPVDGSPSAGTVAVLIAPDSAPSHATADATRVIRQINQNLDISDDAVGAPPVLNCGSSFALAPYFALLVGNSSGAGTGSTTIVFDIGYEQGVPFTSGFVVR